VIVKSHSCAFAIGFSCSSSLPVDAASRLNTREQPMDDFEVKNEPIGGIGGALCKY